MAVAEHILGDSPQTISVTDVARAAWDIRQALLPVPDSAEIIWFVQAFKPDALVPLQRLQRLFEKQLPERQAHWAARTLIHYVLGFVTEEHNQAELISAKIRTKVPDQVESNEAFNFGVTVILEGVRAHRGIDREVHAAVMS